MAPLRFLVLLVACALVPAAPAQEPSKRVEREASNPLRVIIEAGKIRTKARPAEPAASAPPRVAKPAAAAGAEAVAAKDVPLEVLPGPPSSAVATVDVQGEATPLRIVEQIEPRIPEELRALIDGEAQVLVGFTVLPDGRVAEAEVRRSTHPELNAAVLEAVRLWRYQPIGAATPHEVELVLNRS